MNFQEAEYNFRELEKRWAAGQIDAQTYQAYLAKLRVIDASGQVWGMQEHTGRWFIFRDGQWLPANQPQPVVQRPDIEKTRLHQRPAPPPPPVQRPQQPIQQPKRGGWSLAILLGLVGVCLVCGMVTLVGGYLVSTGEISLPQEITRMFPDGSIPTAPDLTQDSGPAVEVSVRPVEAVPVSPNGTPQSDSHGVALVVPAGALEEGGQVNLSANELDAPWRKTVEQAATIDTPFYSLSAAGKNDTTGSLSLSFPASSPNARLLAVIDGEYLVELAQAPDNGKLTVQPRAGPAETSEILPPEGYDGNGSIYYAVITPKAGSRMPSGDQMIALRRVNQADERNCIPDISIIGGTYINLCRQNAAGTVQVMLPTLHRELVPQVDMMVDKIEAVMAKYYSLGFTTAQLSHSSPMLVRVSAKIKNPSYYPLNGVLYIPVDSVSRIATLSPTDVYHEMAHWIQAVKYSTRLAYYSGERTWWLETSAENMVMLVEPSYVGSNLTTYGTISTNDNRLAIQAEPYQWPGDYYVHAQLLKVNLCDSSACPLSPASFAKAISEGVYPLMNGAAKAQVSGNLKDYAYYLLGKSPVSANTTIPLSGPVATGEGYGEYIRITRTNDKDLKYDYNGSDPQMRKETKDNIETLVVEARLERDGVYPLMVLGGAGKNPGLPVEMIIEPGASFYYTLDDGPFQYADGSQEVKLLPIHGQMGIQKVRIVALGINGGEVFKARVQPLQLEGAWVVMPSGEKTGGTMTCTGDTEDMENPDATATLMAYILAIASGTGDMQIDATGRSLDWAEIPSRVPAEFKEGNLTFNATALLAGDAIQYQAMVNAPKSESSLPPVVPIAAAGVFLPLVWLARKHLNPRNLRVLTNVLAIGFLVLVSTGCFGMGMYGSANLDAKFQKIEYVGGQDAGTMVFSEDFAGPQGKPMWKLTGSGTYAVNFTIEVTTTDMDGKDTTETTVCTGSVTYPVMAYVYKDFAVQIPSDE